VANSWDDNQGNVIVSGALQPPPTGITPGPSPGPSPAPTTTSVYILGLAITIDSSTILESNQDEPLTLAMLAALTPTQLSEGQFAYVVLPSDASPLTATSLYLRLLETKIVAPLDDPTSTCPNISVLGQTINTSSAVFGGGGGSTLTCAGLQPGQPVKVTLQDQIGPPLEATEVEVGSSGSGWGCENDPQVMVIAPLNVISITELPYTVSVLGQSGTITVDISNAQLINEDYQPIALGQLMVGQFVQMTLASNVPATSGPQFVALVVKSMVPGNVIGFNVFDWHGHQVNDGSNDVSAAVTYAHKGKGAAKTVTLRTTSNGSFNVANMPKGQAKVAVTRAASGQKSTAANTFNVTSKAGKNVRLVLKPVSR